MAETVRKAVTSNSGRDSAGKHTVRKEQFIFNLEVLGQLCVLIVNMVYYLKICIIGCDDNLKSIQFCQILHTVAYILIPMVHDSVMASYLQQEGSDTLPPSPQNRVRQRLPIFKNTR
jgi:hypothetical protein